MIKFENVCLKYENSEEYALKDINFEIKDGEFVVLLGNSGCGKTAVTRLINHLIPEFYSAEKEGKITIDGIDSESLSLEELVGKVGTVFQDPRSQFFATDTTAEIAFSCENIAMPPEKIRENVNKAVKELELEYLLNRNIFALSSGQKQSIAIASVYALSPKILIFDEPSANLDAISVAKLRKVLKGLKEKGYTIIVAEHRLYYLNDLADKAIFIRNGEIQKIFGKDEFMKLTNQESNALGLRSICMETLKPENKIPKYEADGNKLVIKNLSFSYNKKINPLKDINLEVEKGSIIGVIGCNGAGKTTFLDIVCGIKKESSGGIYFEGQKLNCKNRIKRSFMVMQDSDYQLFTESVDKEFFLGEKVTEELKNKSLELLERMQLSKFQNSHPSTLSIGQKQRLCIALSCMKNVDIICFDEPTSGVDYENMKNINSLMFDLRKKGIIQFVTTHDYEFLMSACTHICYIKDGKVETYFAVNENTAPKIYNIIFNGGK